MGFLNILGDVLGVGSSLSDTAATLTAFFAEITDGKMWRSLAWIVLGAALLLLGIALWLRIPQAAARVGANAAGDAAKAALA